MQRARTADGDGATYSAKAPSDIKAAKIRWQDASNRFEVSAGGSRVEVDLPLIGLHNVMNALGSLAAMAGMGYDVKKAALHLACFRGVPGRLERVDAGQDFLVFVDFAHTPDGLENVLKSFKPYHTRKLIALFGCGGDRDKTKRPKMGKIASDFCDYVYVTSDNPRSEDPRLIADEICSGFPRGFDRFSVVLDRKKAVRQALLLARTGDIVLLAGKGHETEQVIGGEAFPFSDREEAEKVLHGH